MPDSHPDDARQPDAAPGRSTAERAEAHRAVEQLAEDLLPALIAKLSASGLSELEVREGPWKVRLRRPMEVIGTGRRAMDRQFRLPGAGTSAANVTPTPTHVARPPAPGAGRAAPGAAAGSGPGQDLARPEADLPSPVVTSPAVGIFRPRSGISGTRVRAGDRLGAVDMLGIPQEVVAPIDGFVGRLLAEVGDGVEYGQPLMAMRPASAAAPASDAAGGGGDRGAASTTERAGAPAGERS